MEHLLDTLKALATECDDWWRGSGDRTALQLADQLWEVHSRLRRVLEVQGGNPDWATAGEIVVGERGEN